MLVARLDQEQEEKVKIGNIAPGLGDKDGHKMRVYWQVFRHHATGRAAPFSRPAAPGTIDEVSKASPFEGH